MLDEKQVLLKLEEERKYAVESNMEIMAFGIGQAMKIIKDMVKVDNTQFKTIDLNETSKHAVKIIGHKLNISKEQLNSDKWESIQEDVLIDLSMSDAKVFEDTVAVEFADQVHEEMSRKIRRKLEMGE